MGKQAEHRYGRIFRRRRGMYSRDGRKREALEAIPLGEGRCRRRRGREGVPRSVLAIYQCQSDAPPCRHGNDLLSLDGRTSGTLARKLNIRIRISARAPFELSSSTPAHLPISHSSRCNSQPLSDPTPYLTPAATCG